MSDIQYSSKNASVQVEHSSDLLNCLHNVLSSKRALTAVSDALYLYQTACSNACLSVPIGSMRYDDVRASVCTGYEGVWNLRNELVFMRELFQKLADEVK